MDKFFVIKLAFRNLMSHKLRTYLTLVGIIIGISAVIFLISFSFGIQRLVTAQITGGDAFSLIDVGTGNSQVVKLNNDIVSKIKDIEGVKSLESVTNFGGKARNNDQAMDVAIFGISTEKYLEWSGKKIRYGKNLVDGENTKEAVINTAYASFLSNDKPESLLGKTISFDLMLPKELSQTGEARTFESQEFTIVGIIKEDASASLYSQIANFTDAESKSASQLKVRVSNTGSAAVSELRKKIEAYGLRTDYVGDIVNQVKQFFNIFKVILGSFGIIALVVALLGMFNTLTISLLERIKEVALMKIFGMSKKDIQLLFLTEAITLGSIGGLLGIVWGVLLGHIANFILNIMAKRAGGDEVTVFYYAPGLVIIILASAIVIGFFTGFYPARRASRVKTLDVLRYE